MTFPWDNKSLDKTRPIKGPPTYITEGRVSNVIMKMGFRKDKQLLGVVIAMVTSGKDTIMLEATNLANIMIKVERMQNGWNL